MLFKQQQQQFQELHFFGVAGASLILFPVKNGQSSSSSFFIGSINKWRYSVKHSVYVRKMIKIAKCTEINAEIMAFEIDSQWTRALKHK